MKGTNNTQTQQQPTIKNKKNGQNKHEQQKN